MRVLVTGGSGFIGKHLVNKLKENENIDRLYSVSTTYDETPFHDLGSVKVYREFYCDIRSPNSVKRLLHETRPDIIFHLAAISRVKPDEEDPLKIIDINIKGTFNLLNFCQKGAKFIFSSSDLVSGENNSGKFDSVLINSPISVYGATKASCESLIYTFHSQGKIFAKIARLVSNVGNMSTHGVLHDLYKKLSTNSEYLDVIGNRPGSKKPFVHVYDTVNILNNLGFSENNDFEVITIGNNSINIETLCKILMKERKITKKINWLGNSFNWVGDNRVSNVYKTEKFKYKYDSSEEAIKQAVIDKMNNNE